MKIHAGSQSNLNPEILLKTFFEMYKMPLDKYDPKFKRLELYNDEGKPLDRE
jgi:hypothetical protein